MSTNIDDSDSDDSDDDVSQSFLGFLSSSLSSFVWKYVAYPVLLAWFKLSLLWFIALLCMSVLRWYIIPSALVNEPVYFDFSLDLPLASMDILHSEQQWTYMHSHQKKISTDTHELLGLRHLSPDVSYAVHMKFKVSRSRRSVDMAKFMVHFTTFDSTGDAIAKSSRPVVLPYESFENRHFSAIITFPFRMALRAYTILLSPLLAEASSTYSISESSFVSVPLMNNYKEPSRHLPPTHILQCQLSTVDADVEDAWIFVVPSMSGLTYIFYSYPVTSYTIGTVIVFCLEVLCILIWMQRQKMVKRNEMYDDDDDDSSSSGSLMRRQEVPVIDSNSLNRPLRSFRPSQSGTRTPTSTGRRTPTESSTLLTTSTTTDSGIDRPHLTTRHYLDEAFHEDVGAGTPSEIVGNVGLRQRRSLAVRSSDDTTEVAMSPISSSASSAEEEMFLSYSGSLVD